MAESLTTERLRKENLAFCGTNGVSICNGTCGFVPAFLDTDTGRIEIARYANGQPAPMHLLDGLPAEWALARDDAGHVTAIKACIVSGFLRDERFYTREEAANS